MTAVLHAVMAGMTVTGYIVLAIAVAITAIDVVLFIRGGTSLTISAVIIAWSKQYPILPFLFGILMGHLFARAD